MIVLDGKYTLSILTDFYGCDCPELELRLPKTDWEKKTAKRYILLQVE